MLKLCIILELVAFIVSSPTSGSVPRLDGRIVGGVDTNIESYPYQVSLQYYNYFKSHLCGGSIIGNDTVLTAAHCVFDDPTPSRYTVLSGNSDYQLGTRHNVKNIRIHNKYNPDLFDFDVAVLKVSPNFSKGPGTDIVKLINQGGSVGDKTMCNVTGWGTTKEDGKPSPVLQEVAVPTVSVADCRKVYVKSITDQMICAGVTEGGKDACQGDSGGPLVSQGTQIGIVSWGYGCGRPNVPGVYTKVSAVSNWINGARRPTQINVLVFALGLISFTFWE